METESLLPKPGSCRRLMRYWRLGDTSNELGKAKKKKKKMKVVRLKGTRRYWRIKAIPKLSLMLRSPLKLMNKLKNAYIDFMLKLSGKVKGGSLNFTNGIGDGVFRQKRIPKSRQVTHKFSMNEFEARLIYEISKVLIASRELNPM
ncbi:hypothetical protein K1719_001277 [Acacia pycnantha]|nr:hypothetical protein K1719_001277 [Acacia pycnantha]